MKIQKINENQIRCELTKEDLAERQIRLSELAYGSEKARSLFRDMMVQANKECGFSNDAGIPLMIEAIPTSGNSLTVVITKVEDPEELDTRFARFSPTEEVADDATQPPVEGADDIIDMFHKLIDAKKSEGSKKAPAPEDIEGAKAPKAPQRNSRRKNDAAEGTAAPGSVHFTRVFRFRTLDDVIAASAALAPIFKGQSSLYHTSGKDTYMLVVRQAGEPETFNRVCNILSEYGSGMQSSASSEAYLHEHGAAVEEGDAVEKLASLVAD